MTKAQDAEAARALHNSWPTACTKLLDNVVRSLQDQMSTLPGPVGAGRLKPDTELYKVHTKSVEEYHWQGALRKQVLYVVYQPYHDKTVLVLQDAVLNKKPGEAE